MYCLSTEDVLFIHWRLLFVSESRVRGIARGLASIFISTKAVFSSVILFIELF